MPFVSNSRMPAGRGAPFLPVSAARGAREPRTTPAALAILPVLAFLAVLVTATASQALLSQPLPLQLQKPAAEIKTRQPLSLPPKITTVTPQRCVKAGEGTRPGDKVTLEGSNFGFPKPAGYSLAVQPAGSLVRTPVTETGWTATSITFNVPSGLAAESTFTVGILSGTTFFSPVQLTVCAKSRSSIAPGIVLPGAKTIPQVSATASNLSRRPGTLGQLSPLPGQPPPPAGPPEITSISPSACVEPGGLATAYGVNLGANKLAAGFSLGYQVGNEPPTVEINESSWSPSSVSFSVPPGAATGGWFALGIIYEGVFYAQQYVSICGASTGQGGGYYGGGNYGGGYYGGDYGPQESWGGPVAVPKGARRLGPGGVDVQVAPAPTPDETTQEQPQQPGRRAVGGKLLAMKALAGRGLRKVNKECDLFEPRCPCCRKDDSVCLEKESENEDGTSLWVVFWKPGAVTLDGQGAYGAQNAEDDVEAVTGLQCEPVVDGNDGTGSAKFNCR